MSEKTFEINLQTPMTYAGVNYAEGINKMPEAAAKSAIKRKFGTEVGSNKKDGDSEAKTDDFKPLSFDETMTRAEKFDFSDDVVKSLQFHQETIKEFRTSGLSPKEFLEKLEAEKQEFEKLPKNFPMRHVFAKLGADYDSVEKIQALGLEKLIELEGIAEGSAKKALEYKREER